LAKINKRKKRGVVILIEFPEIFSFSFDEYINQLVKWLLIHWGNTFDVISQVILYFLIIIEQIFLQVPWCIMIVMFGLIVWKTLGRWWHGLLVVFMLMLIGSFGYWELTMKTLAIMITAVIFSLVVGIPTGVILARSEWSNTLIRPILDAMQTMPVFVYLIPVLILFGFGRVPAVIATIIYALPPIIRLTNVGIRQVPIGIIEAGHALGLNSWQTLIKIQLPLARPTIMAGINQTTMMALSMVVIGSMIGARGLGTEILIAINRVDIGRGFRAGISVVFLAIILDRIFNSLVQNNQGSNHNSIHKKVKK